MNYVDQSIKMKVGTETIAGKKFPKFLTMKFTPKGRDRFWVDFPFSREGIDIVKTMGSFKWHGHDVPAIKRWSVANNDRTTFIVQYHAVGQPNPYDHFRRPDQKAPITRDILNKAQRDFVDHVYTKGTIIAAHEMGLGKTLAAAHSIEISNLEGAVWWVGPRPALAAAEYEFRKWKITFKPVFMTYNKLVSILDNWTPGDLPPQAIIGDEISKCKNSEAQVSKAFARVASAIRNEWKDKGKIILMSGTPSPKTPVDWYSTCEIACPGYIKEGNVNLFRERLAIMGESILGGNKFKKVIAWRDNDKKCNKCGQDAADIIHSYDHPYEKGKNEVADLYRRLSGLVQVRFLKDHVDLPDRIYKVIRCKVDPSTRRYADLAKLNAKNALSGIILRREISDGFLYDKTPDGMMTCPVCKGTGEEYGFVTKDSQPESSKVVCPMCFGSGDECDVCTDGLIDAVTDGFQECTQQLIQCTQCKGKREVTKYKRIIKEVKCPKDDVLKDILELNEDASRIVVYAGFKESVDRCARTCLKHGWNVIRLDGRGWHGFQADGNPWSHGTKYLDIFQDSDLSNVAFVGNPIAGGMGLTLTRARAMVYYSNSYMAEARQQSERRIHRQGMDLNVGATFYDIIHLPEDEKVLQALKLNKDLQSMSLGEFNSIEKEFANAGFNYEVVE